jgi:glycosyltransferase involved in cell wall biosynthesis
VAALRDAGATVDVVANRDAAVHARLGPKYASLAIRGVARAVAARVRRRRVDVVEAHIAYPTGLVARPLARMLGAPLVLFAHGADVTDAPWRSIRHERLARSTYGAADLVVANGPFLADEVRTRFPEIADRVRAVSPGVEVARFATDPPDDGPTGRAGILFVGRLIPEKGAHVLVRAVASLAKTGRTVRLSVVGDGPERARLAALADERGVGLDLVGPQDRDAVARAMRSALVVAVPSVYAEPLGLVALEAMAAGAIVVASAVGGLAGLVTDGRTGVTATAADEVALAAALTEALAIAVDPARGPAMRAAGRALATGHDVGASARETLALYGTLAR